MTSNHHVIAILGDVAEYINGRAFKPSEWGKEGLPIIRIKNLNDENSKFNYSNEVFEKRYLVKKGDLLFAWSASLGAYIWKKDEAWLNQHIFLVKPSPFIAKLYLYYFLDKITQELYSAAHGSGMVHVTKKKFEETKIGLPPLPEQRAIVAKIEQLFSELDNGIACLKKAQEQLKVYRQAVLKQAFDGELTKSWREQQANLPSAQDLLDTIKADREQAAKNQGKKLKPVTPLSREELDDLPELPDGWEWVRFGDISDVVRGGSPRPAGDPKYYDGDIPFLKVADITKNDDLYITDYEYSIKEAGLKKTRRILKNTLLLSNSGATLGVPKITLIDAAINDGIAAFLNLDSRALIFAYYFWRTKTKELRRVNQGAAQPNLNTDLIKTVFFPLCGFDEQAQIVQEIEMRLSVCDKMEATIRESLEKAEALRQSILKKAFEGKLLSEEELTATRNDPEWEPAEKLLERIRAEKNQSKKQALT